MATSGWNANVRQVTVLDDPVPSYEESVDNKDPLIIATQSEKHSVASKDLATRLAEVQRSRIEVTITEHIMPILHKHIESGLFQASFALILSDLADHWQVTDDALNSDEYPGFIGVARLQGDGNSKRFWQQPQVLQQLEQSLRSRLGLQESSH